jgi:enoyl-CoA hydratase/carnithine racemase
MQYETLLYEVSEHILTLTLNRPDRLNAFTGKMMEELIAAFDQADADDAVRAIIVTGAGRGFCAGPTCRKAPRPSISRPAKTVPTSRARHCGRTAASTTATSRCATAAAGYRCASSNR